MTQPASTIDYAKRTIIVDNVYDSLQDAIGNTPLIRLSRASRETGCNIYGKAEFLNPGGSVKARAALSLIQHAERNGLLHSRVPTIVESTAGNTGISLAQLCASRGYTCIIVMPSSQSQQKKDALKQLGAFLIQVPPNPYSHPNNFVRLAKRLAAQLDAVYTDQFDNVANRDAHFFTTGPEIWAQLRHKLHGFSCAVGSGGTLAGVSRYLRSQNPNVKIALTDPQGAKLVSFFNHGVLDACGDSITEGIGQGRVTENIRHFSPDFAWEIPDAEALDVLYNLMREEGLSLGTSSGINVAGAIRLAKQLGPGHNIVTILCDHSSRYPDKIFNVDFLKHKQLPYPSWIDRPLPQHLLDALAKCTVPEQQALEQQARNVATAAAEASASPPPSTPPLPS